MANRLAVAVLLGLLVPGCGGGSSASLSSPAAGTSRPFGRMMASASLRCRATPVYGRTVGPAASAASVVRLPGVPDGVGATPDGRFAFVALQSGKPRIGVIARTGDGARLLATVPIPAYASGVRVTPDGRHVLAAAGRGAIVLDVAAATSGVGRALVGDLTAPMRVAGLRGPGAAEVAISPNSRYAFVTLEGAGAVAVFDMRRGFGSGAYIGAVPVGAGALGIAASSDGRRLYEVSESGRAPGSGRRGALHVIDVGRAVRTPRDAVVATAAVPCAPVRVATSPDGGTVWITARDGNQLLGFSAGALRSDPARALLSATAVGAAPLGVALDGGGRTVLVADSNLSHAAGSHAGVTVVDTTSAAGPLVTGSIRTGGVADAIADPSGGGVAFVTVSGAREVDRGQISSAAIGHQLPHLQWVPHRPHGLAVRTPAFHAGDRRFESGWGYSRTAC